MNTDILINKLIELECFKEGNFLLKSGKKSHYYIDLRILVSYPKLLKEISILLYNKFKNIDGLLCGLPYAGIPYAQTISVLYNRPMILLRKEKKKHGTCKMIEGNYIEGQEIIIVDDILTSGTSLLESLEHLNKFKIKKIIVIVDRYEGGKEILNNKGYEVESLFSIEDFINIKKYQTIINIKNEIKFKKSNICVSLDYIYTNDILNALEILKNNIVMIKIHCDIIEDFNLEFINKLTKICKENNIFIIEDRKFGDIGNTFKNQFIGGIFKIRDWANFITFHGIVGQGQIDRFNSIKFKNQFILLVSEMSNEGNLLDVEYTNKVLNLAKNNNGNVLGLICQKKILNKNNFLYFTPGIRIHTNSDNSDQKYITPKEAIQNGTDILIVGRGIIESNNILESCKMYQTEGWKYYKNKINLESI